MIERSQLNELVQDLARTALGFELCASEQQPLENPAVTARLALSGEWSGTLEVRCDSVMAAEIAAALFCAAASEVGDEDVNDAVGEITNILAGNIAPLLSNDCRLNLPVIIGEATSSRATEVVMDSVYRSEQAAMAVCLLAEATS